MKTRMRNLGISSAVVLLLLALLFGTLVACTGVKGTVKPEDGPGFTINLVFGPAHEDDEKPRLAAAVRTGPFIVEDLEVRDTALVRGDMTVLGTYTGAGGTFTGTTTVWNAVVTGTMGVSGTLTVLDCIIFENGEMICNDPDGQMEVTTPNFLVGTAIEMAAGVDHSTIGGGETNYISGTVHHAFIGGGVDNEISADGNWGFIGGGDNNLVSAISGAIAGGDGNIASGSWGFVGGGDTNTASGQESVVGGGMDNEAAAQGSVVAGGFENLIPAAGNYSFIGAGDDNLVGDAYSSVVGGVTNTVESEFAFIGGGQSNVISATATWSTIGGGYNNEISTGAIKSFIGGGYTNTISGDFSVIPGGGDNVASADYTYAAGRRAKATHEGAYVWADSTDADYTDNGADTYNVRATDGGFFSHDLNVGDDVNLDTGGGLHLDDATAEGVVFFVMQNITYGITSTVTSAVIPANADVTDWSVVVYTAFNGGGADTLICGISGVDADKWVDDLDVSALNRHFAGDAVDMQQDEWLTSFGDVGGANATIACQYTDANMDASAGGATFMLWYRID